MSLVSKVYGDLHEFENIGDIHEFSIEVPLRGWAELSSISLTTTGTTVTRYLDILVSYTTDALNYSDFEALSSPITVSPKTDFIVKIKLIRAGVDNTGTIILTALTLNGDFQQSYYDVWDLSGTVFADIKYENVRWNKLWINLLKKFYLKGIIPEFIERGKDVYPADHDYIEFWKYQCMFWALTVELGFRKIEDLSETRSDLLEYLEQKTLFFCEDEVTLEQLQYVMKNVWDEIRQRGTHMIHYKANVALGGGTPNFVIPYDLKKQIDGELLRYLCYDAAREFVFAYYSRLLSGWVLDRTSPNYYCYTEQIQLNKAPEFTEDFKSLTNFTVYNPANTYLEDIFVLNILTEDGDYLTTEDNSHIISDGKQYGVLHIEASGIDATDLLALEESDGNDFFVQENSSGYIALEESSLVADLGIQGNGVRFGTVVDAKLSYECTMWIYAYEVPNDSLSIWVKAYKDAGATQIALLRADGQLPLTLEANVLFQKSPLQAEKFWFLRFTIESIYNYSDSESAQTNWGVGNNLKFYDLLTDKIEVFVLNQGNADFAVWDLKFRPMKFENTYGLDNYNTTILLANLNNQQVTKSKFVDDVTQYLLPYGGGFYFDDLNEIPLQFNLLTEDGDPINTENDLNILV